MTAVARYPDSTKASLEQRLCSRARDRWPQIASLHIRHRGNFSYVDAALADGTMLKLCRLRYVGSASQWQFAIYRASHDDYDESVFPTGLPVGTCQDALDTACGLYLNDPTAWIQPPTNLRARPLSKKNYADDGQGNGHHNRGHSLCRCTALAAVRDHDVGPLCVGKQQCGRPSVACRISRPRIPQVVGHLRDGNRRDTANRYGLGPGRQCQLPSSGI